MLKKGLWCVGVWVDGWVCVWGGVSCQGPEECKHYNFQDWQMEISKGYSLAQVNPILILWRNVKLDPAQCPQEDKV